MLVGHHFHLYLKRNLQSIKEPGESVSGEIWTARCVLLGELLLFNNIFSSFMTSFVITQVFHTILHLINKHLNLEHTFINNNHTYSTITINKQARRNHTYRCAIHRRVLGLVQQCVERREHAALDGAYAVARHVGVQQVQHAPR